MGQVIFCRSLVRGISFKSVDHAYKFFHGLKGSWAGWYHGRGADTYLIFTVITSDLDPYPFEEFKIENGFDSVEGFLETMKNAGEGEAHYGH